MSRMHLLFDRIRLCFLVGSMLAYAWSARADDPLLTGTAIGSSPSVDYSTSSQSTTVNLPTAAFDGDLSTFFASYARSYTYVGLDLGAPYVITKVGWSPRNDGVGPDRTKLAVFEGANRADFLDALPLYITDESGTIGQMSYANIDCSKGFRYVRYVGPSSSRCNVAEVAFYGHAGVGDECHLYRPTNLPCVVIHTQNNAEPADKVNDIGCYIQLLDENGGLLQDSAGIRLRGNASIDFDKKPYRIKFAKKHHVCGSPANARKWNLVNNYGDKTLMRNMIAFEYSRRFGMEYTPFCQPVDVFLNGEYKGCYQLCDHLDINKNRVGIEEMTPADDSGTALTGGYFIEMDGYAYNEPEQARFYSAHYNMGITIKSPDEDSITQNQKNYIQSFFNQMENLVYCDNFSDPQNGWRSRLDETSWIKHFLIGELSGNTDTYWSCHFYKHRGENMLYTGPEWDFDIAFDNDYRHYPSCNMSDYVYKDAGTNRSFVVRTLETDTSTLSAIRRIWSEARNTKGLCADTINALIDDWAAYMDASQRLNFMRWPILSKNVHMNPRNAGSYAGEIAFIKAYVTRRFQWMDQKIGLSQSTDGSAIDAILSTDGLTRIWNIQGLLLYEGKEMPELPAGLYVVQHDGKTKKLAICN